MYPKSETSRQASKRAESRRGERTTPPVQLGRACVNVFQRDRQADRQRLSREEEEEQEEARRGWNDKSPMALHEPGHAQRRVSKTGCSGRGPHFVIGLVLPSALEQSQL